MVQQLANGNEIINLLLGFSELDWAKFESRMVKIEIRNGVIEEDRSTHPPYSSFRLKHEDTQLLEALSRAVITYSGAIEWVLVSHSRSPLPGTNWCICPKEVELKRPLAVQQGITVSQYFITNSPSFGPKAYEDMLPLAEHMSRFLLGSFPKILPPA